jgi:hypothetical protein
MTFSGQAAQSLYDYRKEMDRAVAGLLMDSNTIDELSKMNSGVQTGQTIGDITVAGTIATGNDFSLTIAVMTAIGTIVSKTVTYKAVAGNDAAAVAGKLKDAINAEELLNDFVSAANTSGVLKLTVRQNRKIQTIAASATGAATITAAPAITNATEPALIPWGYFVGQYPGFSDNQAGAITSNTNARILGICKKYNYQTREEPYNPLREFGILPFHNVLIVPRARIWVPVSGSVARGDRVAYLNTTGQPCKDGTANSTPVTGTEFVTASGPDGLAGLSINLPA